MSAGPAFSLTQIVMFLALGSGMGLPFGVPPQTPDPMLASVAPADCLYYASWAGMAQPDAASTNQTEQLLAEPEVQAFIAEVQQVMQRGVQKLGARSSAEEQMVMQKIPLLAKTLVTHGAALYVESVQLGENGVQVEGALVVHLGEDLSKVRDALQTIRGRIPPQIAQDVDVDGHECVRLQPEVAAPAVTIGFHEQYLIVAIGEQSFAGALKRVGQTPPTWLTQAREEVPVARPSTLAYLNVAALRKLAEEVAPPPFQAVVNTLGLNAVQRVVSASGLDEEGFVSTTRVFADAPARGLLDLMSAEPLTAADLSGIPADASLAIAGRLDLARLLDKGLEMVGEIEPRAIDAFELNLSQVEQALGVQLKQDLLQSLGDVWTLHTAPSSGGVLTGWTLAVSVRDKERLAATHQKLLLIIQSQLAQAGPGRAPRIRMFQSGETTIYSLDIPEEDFPLAPCWCLTDSHLVVAALPQAIKSYLVQASAKESIVAQPAVARLLSEKEGPLALAYQDTRSQFQAFYPWIQLGAQVAVKQLQKEGIEADVAALPSIASIAPHLLPSVSSVQRTSDGWTCVSRGTLPGMNVGASAPVLVALLLPAVQSAREAARRAQSMNNMKQIGLAMHNYHDVYRGFPPSANVDKDGKPLLSWRVHILPYLEQQALYQEFHLDEPWDSEHNRKLIDRMPVTYRSPNSMAGMGKTVYLGNAGNDGIFVPQATNKGKQVVGLSFARISDGTSNTIMVIEASDDAAVTWTKPDDFSFKPDQPLKGLTNMRPGGFLAGFCDGSVRFISSSIDQSVLKALFTANGGEATNIDY